MVLEVAVLQVKRGQTESFEKDFEKAEKYIEEAEGYINHQLKRCLEVAGKYVLLVNWLDIEAHEEGFKKSEDYQNWKKLLHHNYDPFPTVEHYVSL